MKTNQYSHCFLFNYLLTYLLGNKNVCLSFVFNILASDYFIKYSTL